VRGAGLALAGTLALWGCAGATPGPPSHFPDRLEYDAFRVAHPGLLEPNYLPFMADAVRLQGGGGRLPGWLARWIGRPPPAPRDYLVFCHWSADRFPLSVFIEPPVIPEDLRDARTRSPAAYVAAVRRALALWQKGLEGLVSFTRAPSRADADVVFHLTLEERRVDEADIEVLGETPLSGACRYRGGDPATGRLDVEFRVPELTVHVADRFGLLLPDQVEKIALHEIGHALGMRGHSPIPADLMYPVVRDRLPRGELGTEDVNSFLSLYRLPSGTIYLRVDPDAPPRPAEPLRPEGPPRLALAPHVDTRRGFEIQLPADWVSIDTDLGVAAVDGTTWDYEASLQVNVHPEPDARSYLRRYGAWYLSRGRPLGPPMSLEGRYPGLRLRIVSPDDRLEQVVLLEPGDGRVVAVTFDCPLEDADAWSAWFEATLATLELRSPGAPDASGGGRAYESDDEDPPPVR
jgi:hypothetical protein